MEREFPRGPVVRTLHFHYRGHEFDPWSGNKDPTSLRVWQNEQINKQTRQKQRNGNGHKRAPLVTIEGSPS